MTTMATVGHVRGWPVALVLGLAAVAAGCLSRPSLVQQSFSFVAPVSTNTYRTAGTNVLEIRRVEVAAPFDDALFTYRTGDYSFEHDPYAKFLAPPAQSLSLALQTAFRNSGAFAAVTEPGSVRRPGQLVEVKVDKLYGDFRHENEPRAVLAIRFAFFAAGQGAAKSSLLDREFTREIPLEARTAAAVMAGWNQALDQIVTAAVHDLEQRESGPPAGQRR